MFEFEFDALAGILVVRVLGVWTLPEVQRYGREAAGQFASARAKAGRLRLLIDCSKGHICPQDLVEPLARAGLQHSRNDDSAALVVSSSLMKLQVKRMMTDAPVNMFVSESAAKSWLKALDVERRSLVSAA
jgi:hypothetical protein